jgi:hypothetical protein
MKVDIRDRPPAFHGRPANVHLPKYPKPFVAEYGCGYLRLSRFSTGCRLRSSVAAGRARRTLSEARKKDATSSGKARGKRISKPEKIRNRHKRNSHCDEQNTIGYKVRKHHQPYPAQQGHYGPLSATVNDKAEPDRAKQQSPKKRRRIQRPAISCDLYRVTSRDPASKTTPS